MGGLCRGRGPACGHSLPEALAKLRPSYKVIYTFHYCIVLYCIVLYCIELGKNDFLFLNSLDPACEHSLPGAGAGV